MSASEISGSYCVAKFALDESNLPIVGAREIVFSSRHRCDCEVYAAAYLEHDTRHAVAILRIPEGAALFHH